MHKDIKEFRVQLEHKDIKVFKVHKDIKVFRVQLEHKDIKEFKVQQVQ